MAERNSSEYYKGREQKERMLAEVANDPAIAAIHLDLAERYAEMIQTAFSSQPEAQRA